MIAILQAGGAGTRLKAISGNLPKPMVPIGGKPILEHEINNLVENGITELYIVISKKGKSIPQYFGDGSSWGAHIHYLMEEEPLGTGGVLALLHDVIQDDFIFCFADLMFHLSWSKFIAFHEQSGAAITAFAHPNSHPYDSDVLVADSAGFISRIESKNGPRLLPYENLTNAGLYVAKKEVADFVVDPVKIDFEKVILQHFIEQQKANVYRSSEYVKDCGTPERYEMVCQDLKEGIVFQKSLDHPQKCIFLDRDGTINRYQGYVTRLAEMELLPGVAKAIRSINHSPYLAICVTNQPVVARGEATETELQMIHRKMEDLLGEEGAYLDDLYYCPHHPDKGFPGERIEYKIECTCRKPKIGMLLKAQEHYHIDFKESWMIGDTYRDVETGYNAGCKTILLTSGAPHKGTPDDHIQPDFVFPTLEEAVSFVLSKDGTFVDKKEKTK